MPFFESSPLMALLVVRAPSDAAFSPFALIGDYLQRLIAKRASQLPAIQEAWTLNGLAWKI